MNDKITLKAAADAAGITIDKVRHWSVALGYEVEKVGRVRHVSAEVVDALREMAVKVSGGISPQSAATLLKARPQAADVMTSPVATFSPDVAGRMDALEKSLMLLVDKIAVQDGKISGQEKTIALQEEKLVIQQKEISALRERSEFQIMLLNAPPKPVKSWEPVRVQPPAMPWYERLWLQMFSPESLRKATE